MHQKARKAERKSSRNPFLLPKKWLILHKLTWILKKQKQKQKQKQKKQKQKSKTNNQTNKQNKTKA